MDYQGLFDNALILGVFSLIVIFSVLFGLLLWNFFGPSETIVSSDFNSTLNSEEHLAIAQNQQFIVEALGVLQEQRLCGLNEVIKDSDNKVIVKTNEVPKGLVYSCFVPTQEAR